MICWFTHCSFIWGLSIPGLEKSLAKKKQKSGQQHPLIHNLLVHSQSHLILHCICSPTIREKDAPGSGGVEHFPFPMGGLRSHSIAGDEKAPDRGLAGCPFPTGEMWLWSVAGDEKVPKVGTALAPHGVNDGA